MRRIRKIIRGIVWFVRFSYWRYYRGVVCDKTVRIGRAVMFDRTYPRGIHIGRHTYITNNVTILTHDHVRSRWDLQTVIGAHCFIGNHAIILPGLTIGSHVIVGAGSVVTKDVPPHCVVAGNPAVIIRTGISLNEDARLIAEFDKDT